MIRVLIVEDEPALARGLSLLITKNYTDFEVLGICKNGRECHGSYLPTKWWDH